MDIQTILVMDVSESDESKRPDTNGEDRLNNPAEQLDFKLSTPPAIIIC